MRVLWCLVSGAIYSPLKSLYLHTCFGAVSLLCFKFLLVVLVCYGNEFA